jgi:peptidoglycan/LPS O-acetylase OafA/YrhL
MKKQYGELTKQNKLASIQLLRGLAVLLVIFYHYGFVDYGYVGVDLFFAISGYVIMSSIYKNELFLGEPNKSKDLRVFLKNRFNRIYPPLLLLLILTSIYSLFQISLNDNSFTKFSRNILFSSLSLSNLYAYQDSTDYFDANNFHKPLLHLWSVSAEFQIYVGLAVLFYVLAKKNKTRVLQMATILVLTIFSLFSNSTVGYEFFAKIGNDYVESFLFYSSFGRFWEFGFGCIVFMCAQNMKVSDLPKKIILSPIYVLIVLGLVVGIKWQGLFGITLLPMLIICWKQDDFKNIYIQFISAIGNRSYSLYLYHMPVIFFFYYSRESVFNLLFSMALIAGLSEISYKWIETLRVKLPKVYFNLFNSLSFGLILFMALFMRSGLPNNFFTGSNTNLLSTNSQITRAGWELKFENCAANEVLNSHCQPLDSNSLTTLVGDSHAGSFVQVRGANSDTLKFDQSLLAAGCSLVLPEFSDNPKCSGLSNEFKEILTSSKSSQYFLSEDFALYGSLYSAKVLNKRCTPFDSCSYDGFIASSYSSRLETFFNKFLSGNSKKLTIIGASPRLVGWPNQFNLWNTSILDQKIIKVKYNSVYAKKINNDLSRLVVKLDQKFHDRIDFIDTTKYICTNVKNQCDVFDRSLGSLYWDADHFSMLGAQLVIDRSGK